MRGRSRQSALWTLLIAIQVAAGQEAGVGRLVDAVADLSRRTGALVAAPCDGVEERGVIAADAATPELVASLEKACGGRALPLGEGLVVARPSQGDPTLAAARREGDVAWADAGQAAVDLLWSMGPEHLARLREAGELPLTALTPGQRERLWAFGAMLRRGPVLGRVPLHAPEKLLALPPDRLYCVAGLGLSIEIAVPGAPDIQQWAFRGRVADSLREHATTLDSDEERPPLAAAEVPVAPVSPGLPRPLPKGDEPVPWPVRQPAVYTAGEVCAAVSAATGALVRVAPPTSALRLTLAAPGGRAPAKDLLIAVAATCGQSWRVVDDVFYLPGVDPATYVEPTAMLAASDKEHARVLAGLAIWVDRLWSEDLPAPPAWSLGTGGTRRWTELPSAWQNEVRRALYRSAGDVARQEAVRDLLWRPHGLDQAQVTMHLGIVAGVATARDWWGISIF
ncbi:MAG: hypothetical protein HZB16_15740 [Armatimonadetes bacterium]|nr:hypothetical protein [Armatimonadota bacterium]